MKPTAYKYQLSGQEESYQVVIESELITRETAHYPEKLKIVPLYTIEQVREIWYSIDRWCETSSDRWDCMQEENK